MAGQPVISVDTKKKELIGNFRNSGSDYRPKGCPIDVNMHDFKAQIALDSNSHFGWERGLSKGATD